MAGEPFDSPASAGAFEQEKEYYARKIVEAFPERAADSSLVYGNPKTEYFSLVNAGEISGSIESKSTNHAMPFKSAWDSASVEVLRNWFRANTGPRVKIDMDNPLTGLITITNQKQANALKGKLIRGSVKVAAPNLDISDFIVQYNGIKDLISLAPAARGGHIHDIELDGMQNEKMERGISGDPVLGMANTVTVERINIHDSNDGMAGFNSSTIRHVWIHDPFVWDVLVKGPYNSDLHPHSDGIQFVSAKNTLVEECFIEMLAPTPNIIAAVIMNTSVNVIDNVTFNRSYFAGGGYTINFIDDGSGVPTNTTFKDCRFGGGYNVGLFSFESRGATAKVNWAGKNVWADTLEEVPHEGTTDRHQVLTLNETIDWGYVETFSQIPSGPQVMPAANSARYAMALTSGWVRRIALQVEASSGNVCVGIYRGKNGAFNRAPEKLVTSVTVPCPPKEFAMIPLNAPVYVRAGDWLAVSTDNATASFMGFTGSASPLVSGHWRSGTDSFPLQDNPNTSPGGYRVPGILGLP